MRKFAVTVEFSSPYMQHRMDDQKLADWVKQRGRIVENEGADDAVKQTALYHSYFDDKGFYIPKEHFKQSFCKGGGFVKAKVGNSTRSMKNIVASQWYISEEKIYLGKPFDEIDTRSAVNKAIKGRVVVHRPKWNNITVSFHLETDDDDSNAVTKETIQSIIDYSGRYIGVGSYRPEHTGEFGRFKIKSFEQIK